MASKDSLAYNSLKYNDGGDLIVKEKRSTKGIKPKGRNVGRLVKLMDMPLDIFHEVGSLFFLKRVRVRFHREGPDHVMSAPAGHIAVVPVIDLLPFLAHDKRSQNPLESCQAEPWYAPLSPRFE
jgi:hypothetical protein